MLIEKKRKTKKVNEGRSHTPVFMQFENPECGAASLAMILAYYGRYVRTSKLRELTGPCRDGSNAYNIAKVGELYGLETTVRRLDAETFLSEAGFPCIVHWRNSHFLVVTGSKGDKVYINDPARGNYHISVEEFTKNFSEFCIFFRPCPGFYTEGRRKHIGDLSSELFKGKLPYLFAIAVLVLGLTILQDRRSNLILPLIDILLAFPERLAENIHYIYLLLGFAVAEIVILLLQAILLLKTSGKVERDANKKYMDHVLHLPIAFFEQRLPGDISFRKQMLGDITTVLINVASPLLLQAALIFIYLHSMAKISLGLLAIVLIASIMNAAVGIISAQRRIEIGRLQNAHKGKQSSLLAAGVHMADTIKAAGAENAFFKLWADSQMEVIESKIRFDRLVKAFGALPALTNRLTFIITLLVGIYFIVNKQITIGGLLSFQSLLTEFNEPLKEMILNSERFTELQTNLERLDDVIGHEKDVYWQDPKKKKQEIRKLAGRVRMDKVTFGYSRMEKPLLENFDMELEQGKSIAFVGSSGCGKSTLAKLISGIYQPWSGEIRIDGISVPEIDRQTFANSVAVVDQEIMMFEDTIFNNISMWNPKIMDFDVILAARDAQIHDDIMKCKGAYQHMMLTDGVEFSGGQRQRMEIARVLAQDPTLIILDEATSALDAATEYNVVKAIAARGISMIVIAHRLSTIRDCDEIIVLDEGKVLERGSHSELLKKNGHYARLIRDE